MAVNLAALPATLIESELFGHERGAVHGGATSRRAGRFELAQGGTLFLVEFGDLDPLLQTKLLGACSRTGAPRGWAARSPSLCRSRVLTATNKPVRPGQPGASLREDLYYRLAVFEIEVPPLRARGGATSRCWCGARAARRARRRAPSSRTRWRTCKATRWPGNVRELLHRAPPRRGDVRRRDHRHARPSRPRSAPTPAGPRPRRSTRMPLKRGRRRPGAKADRRRARSRRGQSVRGRLCQSSGSPAPSLYCSRWRSTGSAGEAKKAAAGREVRR